jgi:glycosyltransferase involved in cell wall biosynthesis
MSLSRTLPNVVTTNSGHRGPLMLSSNTLSFQLQRLPSLPQRIGVIGNHLPRQCGIATFTTDLCDALESEFRAAQVFAVPVTDPDSTYSYPGRVGFELNEGDLSSYARAKDFLNSRNTDVVCLQHEYGIFGGTSGSYILRLLRELKMPLVTTLHTVLQEPDVNQRRVMEEIAALSSRLIVMSRHSARLLQDVFRVPTDKIDLIHHGVPDLPFTDSSLFKASFGIEGKMVLLTFGLLSPNKGIENVIAALPEIVSRRKNVVFLIVGATHPHIMRREGDRYRRQLQTLARDLGVEANIQFHHRFVRPDEMADFIGAADIYITPYRHEAQVSSGTLAYALGAGKAIISTPYWHAAELLANGRGVLVPFQDPNAIAQKAIGLLENEDSRYVMRKRAYMFARAMVWKNVARLYMESFQRAKSDWDMASTTRSPISGFEIKAG